VDNLIETNEIVIVSGEGTGPGTVEKYEGKRTLRAIKTRLTKERCGGDRWARAIVYSHESDWGPAGVDIIAGEYEGWTKPD
jgi:hypothetical protein